MIGSGGRAFLVGGPVRDLLMGRTPRDWDVATDFPPDEVLRVFPDASTVGAEFGRIQVGGVDVVSLRAESDYSDRRHPSRVVFGVSLLEDLKRRDFTINAMAAEFHELEVFDPFSGAEDLERKVIRAVGEPLDRFSEDPLRVLRAIRFEAELDMTLHPSVAAVLPEAAPFIVQVSGERIFAELSRTLLSPEIRRGMSDMAAFGLARFALPEIFVGDASDVYLADKAGRSASLAAPDLTTRLALLFSVGGGLVSYDEKTAACPLDDLLERAKAAFVRFNLPSSMRRDVLWLLRNAGEGGFAGRAVASGEADGGYLARKLLDEAGWDQVRRLVDLERAAWEASGRTGLPPHAAILASGLQAESDDARFPIKLALSGEDVMRTLGRSGPPVGEALAYLKEVVLRDPRKNEVHLLEQALREWRRSP